MKKLVLRLLLILGALSLSHHSVFAFDFIGDFPLSQSSCVESISQLHELGDGAPRPLSSRDHYHADPDSFKKRAEPIAVEAGSFAAQYDDVVAEFESIKDQRPSVSIFLEEFKKDHNRNATVAEVGEYVLDQKANMAKALEKAAQRNRKLDRNAWANFLEGAEKKVGTSESSREKFEKRKEAFPEQFNAAFSFDAVEHRSLVSSMSAAVAGEMGELEYVLKLKDVTARGMRFSGDEAQSKEMAHLTKETFEKWRDQLDKKPKLIDSLKSTYPLIFADRSHRDHKQNSDHPSHPLDHAEAWVRTKEIDVICFSRAEKITTWIEVKNLIGPMDLKTFSDDTEGKSYFEQLQEMVELRNFLGLKDKVKLKVAYKSGLTQEVREIIKGIDIEVIGTIVD